MLGKKTLSAILAVFFTLTVLIAVVPAATASSSVIPAQPQGAPNLITGAPTIAAGGMAESFAYNNGTLNIVGKPSTEFCAEYALDSSLTAESEYVISVDFDMPADARYSNDHGPIVIFRKNTEGKYLGLWMLKGGCYLRTYTLNADNTTFTAAGGEWKAVPLLPDGSKGTLKLYSKPNGVWVEVYDENGVLQTVNGTDTSTSWGIYGGAPAFALSTNGSQAKFSNAVIYNPNYVPATTTTEEGTTTTVNGATTTTTVAGATTTTTTEASTTVATTTTTAPEVPTIDMTKVPVRPAGVNSLINNKVAFESEEEEVISRNGNTLKVALRGETYKGYFDLKGLSSDNAYAIKFKVKVTEPYADYSGIRIHFAGSTGDNDCYQLALLKEAAYVLNIGYENAGKYNAVFSDAEYTYEQNKTQEVCIIVNGNRLSVFVDGKALFADAELPETRTPMFAVSNAVCGWEMSNIEMWDLNAKAAADDKDDAGSTDDSDSSTKNPATGVVVPVMALVALTSGSAVAMVASRKRK